MCPRGIDRRNGMLTSISSSKRATKSLCAGACTIPNSQTCLSVDHDPRAGRVRTTVHMRHFQSWPSSAAYLLERQWVLDRFIYRRPVASLATADEHASIFARGPRYGVVGPYWYQHDPGRGLTGRTARYLGRKFWVRN